MNALDKANEVRLQNALNKLYRFEDGKVRTLRAHLEEYAVKYDTKLAPRIEYNRIKFNRMDYKQQAEYERKLAEKKTIYVAYYADGSYLEVPKMVFDYFTNEEL